jgi:hypothetical protein
MRSKFLSLNVRDFLRGLLLAVLTAVLTFAYEALQQGTLFSKEGLKAMGLAALSALMAYLLKNFFSNSQGEILALEPKV